MSPNNVGYNNSYTEGYSYHKRYRGRNLRIRRGVEPLSFLEAPADYGGIEAENYRDTRERTPGSRLILYR